MSSNFKLLSRSILVIGFLISNFHFIHAQSNNKLFSEKISYQFGQSPLYNGNISSVQWENSINVLGSQYKYEYDSRNQLIKADYFSKNQAGFMQDGQFGVPEITYDKNGNIKKLTRTSATGINKDELNYSYNNENQLVVLEELGDLGLGFTSNLRNATYNYDPSGNLIRDDQKGLTIHYNEFNLPDTMVFDSGDSLIIVYDGTGKKLRKRVVNANGGVNDLFYLDGILVNESSIEAIQHSFGRLVPDNGFFRNEYVIKDHLGNARVHFSDLNTDGQIDDQTEVTQVNDYYPFGMKMDNTVAVIGNENPYQYNGKEFTADLDLNWLDYGARWYDPAIGRWSSVDPLADAPLNIGTSPYAYVWNNPLRFIDPDGRHGQSVDDYYLNLKSGEVEYHEGETGDKLKSDGLVWVAGEGQDLESTVTEIRSSLDASGLDYSERAGFFHADTEEAYAGYQTYKLGKAIQYDIAIMAGGELLSGSFQAVKYLRHLGKATKGSSQLGKVGTKLFGKSVQHTTTRMGRDGKAVEIIFKDGSKMDINAARVKQWIPNTHPKAPAGTLQKVKFPNSLPGTKGYKRLPTEQELKILNGF